MSSTALPADILSGLYATKTSTSGLRPTLPAAALARRRVVPMGTVDLTTMASPSLA